MNKYDELILKEIKDLLIKMHKGESLTITVNKLMEMVRGIKYVEERKFIYMLKGLHMDKMGGLPDVAEDRNKIEGYNEAADESNFAVKLAISTIIGEE